MTPTRPTETERGGIPVLPLKNAVLLPEQLQPIIAGRAASASAVEAALASDEKEILVVTQRDPSTDKPTPSDLHGIACLATVKKAVRLPNGTVQVLVQGHERAVIVRADKTEHGLEARVRIAPVEGEADREIEALHHENRALMRRYLQIAAPEGGVEPQEWIESESDPRQAAYLFAAMVHLDVEDEQQLLAAATLRDLHYTLHKLLTHEVQVLELRNEITSKAQGEMQDEQREYMLRKQLRAIQEELGETDQSVADAADLRERFESLELPERVQKDVERELRRMETTNPASPEHGVIRSYLEFLFELPWNVESDAKVDIAFAREVLDRDHFGLEEVKKRILEHLGVLRLNPDAKAPILCFVGPPGVGKTSLGKSIATALGREFERMSLGGLSDESELRGHRRTYIGAMPGRLMQALRRVGVRNPVLMLDEVDKLGRHHMGDPAAALLEVLDPEQNNEFRDNYLDQPFDLSKVLFVVTANDLDTIPRPLLDRLEIIPFSGYSEEEKLEIARRYLLPASLEAIGLDDETVQVEPDALRRMIQGYTREAGVRRLKRRVDQVLRKVALEVAESDSRKLRTVRAEDLRELLGPETFLLEEARRELPPGVAQGLAWTPVGGEVLYIETSLLPKSKGLTLTGQLGDVMRESATTAQSWVWSHAERLGIEASVFEESGLHVHAPAGATPKDGPSAGITVATALVSLYTGARVRKDTAMTGEITLTGLVLPVGGIKEKVLAARRAGILRVVLPAENEKDIVDLPEAAREEMEFIFVREVGEVLAAALESDGSRGDLRRAS